MAILYRPLQLVNHLVPKNGAAGGRFGPGNPRRRIHSFATGGRFQILFDNLLRGGYCYSGKVGSGTRSGPPLGLGGMAVEPNTSTQNGLPPGEDAEVALRCRLGQITILLDREQGVSTKVPEKPSWSYRDNLGRHPHLLAWFIPVALVILAVVVGLSIHLLTRSTLIQTADYRWGPHYNDHVISDAVDVPDRAAVVLSTRGGGVHTLDRKANYWRQYTRQNTRGRLLRDDVLSVETDAGGNFYFLCTQDGLNGLCRASPDLGRWNVLIGLDQFKALAGPKPARPTAVVQHGGTVWLTTDSAGVGEYDRTSHQWTSFYTTDNSGLGSNAVFSCR